MNITINGIKILRKLKLLEYLNIYPKISIENLRIKIPILKGIGEQNLHISEPWMLDLFKSYKEHLAKGTFLDVGFNVGQTLIKYRSIFQKTKYVGFDPNPICTYYVKELIQSNEWRNVEIIPAAISSTTDIQELFLYEEQDVDSSATIIKEFRNNMPVKQIFHIPVFDIRAITRFEEMMEDSLSCIKIDVEGGELEVIQCFSSLINKKRPLVLIEILPIYNESNKVRLERQQEIENVFRKLNYRCQLIIKTDQNRLKTLKKIDAIEINTDINHCDYFYSPAELSL